MRVSCPKPRAAERGARSSNKSWQGAESIVEVNSAKQNINFVWGARKCVDLTKKLKSTVMSSEEFRWKSIKFVTNVRKTLRGLKTTILSDEHWSSELVKEKFHLFR